MKQKDGILYIAFHLRTSDQLEPVTRHRVTFSSQIYQSFFLEMLLLLIQLLTILIIGDVNIYVTVRVLYLISSFLLVCCIDVFCLSFFFKQQHKHFRGAACIPSIYVHSLSSFMALLQLLTIIRVQILRYWVCFPFSLLLTTGRSACKTGSSA